MTDIHALAGAYVLDAVDDIERATFRRHLDECETCALEVAELSETAGRLTELTWQTPPPTLREEVLAQVASTPQVRAIQPAQVDAADRAGRWRRRAALAVAAGVAVIGVGAGTYLVQEQRIQDERARAEAIESRSEQIDAVLTAPDAALYRAPATGGTVTVVGSRVRDEAVVVLELPAPSPEQAYELWLRSGGEFTSAGVLPARQGSATTLVTRLGDADMIGVSLEPAGGSPTGQPTVGRIVATVPMT
jgi:anti-sigma-K factor RskA